MFDLRRAGELIRFGHQVARYAITGAERDRPSHPAAPSRASAASPRRCETGTAVRTEPASVGDVPTDESPSPSTSPATLTDGVVRLRPQAAAPGADATGADRTACFTVESAQVDVGVVAVTPDGRGSGELSWELAAEHRRRGLATRAVRLLVRHAFDDLAYTRLQAHVDSTDGPSLRLAGRVGLRREGVLRGVTAHGSGDLVLLARLADDPEPSTRAGFVGLVNASLPRKRVIAHVIVRDEHGRVLVCETTYKTDWEMPGGVVEPLESPRAGARREVREELGIDLPIGRLLALDWLPPWQGWDDAIELLFDGGVHDATALLDRCALEPREIRRARFCTGAELRELCTPATYERISTVLAASTGDVVHLEAGQA